MGVRGDNNRNTVSPTAFFLLISPFTVKLELHTVSERPRCLWNISHFLVKITLSFREHVCWLNQRLLSVPMYLFFSQILNSTKADLLARYVLAHLSFIFSLNIYVISVGMYPCFKNPKNGTYGLTMGRIFETGTVLGSWGTHGHSTINMSCDGHQSTVKSVISFPLW